tara:strand:- start:629 stop:889 length:261 start_codon:yes stop_codon:yes gene_type:complete
MAEGKMNYREAKRVLEQQKSAQETINKFKGLETFGSRIGYPSNSELIIDLLEMESDGNIVSLLERYDYLLNPKKSDSKADTSPEEE